MRIRPVWVMHDGSHPEKLKNGHPEVSTGSGLAAAGYETPVREAR